MTLLEVSGLSKSYARRRNLLGRPRDYVRAVHNVSLSVGPNETVALVGESGAGKSTVGRLILRLIEPDAGAVSFEGVDVLGLRKSELRTLRQRMQMIFQDPYSSLDPHVTVGESIGEPLLVHFGMKAGERRERAISLLKHIGMDEGYADRLPRELSGGQLQRAAIARALTLEPKLIICDEPVAALDLSIRAQVLNLMKQLQEEMGIAFLFVSHDLGLVRAMADRVMVMYRGEIVEEGATAEIFSDAKHEYTRKLLAAMPRIRRWQAGTATGAWKSKSPSLAAADGAANPG